MSRLDNDAGPTVEHATRYYLRPGKEYSAARSVDGFDFYLTHKAHSRREAAFVLRTSDITDVKDTQVTVAAGTSTASHSPVLTTVYKVDLVITGPKKALWYHEPSMPEEEEVELLEGGTYTVRDGSRIRLVKPGLDVESFMQ